MWKYKSKFIQVGRSWTDDNGRKFPANWNSMTRSQKDRAGLIWGTIKPPPVFDERFYYTATSPRPLDDKPFVDEKNNPLMDVDGKPLIEEGLKKKAIAEVKKKANELLAETDWMVIRSQEKGTAIDAAVQTYRDGVRTAADTIEKAINAAADMDAFKALYKAPTDKGEIVGNAPIDNWPEMV